MIESQTDEEQLNQMEQDSEVFNTIMLDNTAHDPLIPVQLPQGTLLCTDDLITENIANDVIRIVGPTASINPVCIVAIEFPEELKDGLHEIAQHCTLGNFKTTISETGDNFVSLRFISDASLAFGAFKILQDASGSHSVLYRRRIEAFRALGVILGQITNANIHQSPISDYSASCQFESIGPMVDCSRGAVLRLKSVFFLLRQCALMGLNTFQLYTEDTYKVDDEPFFGFLRGGYSFDELKKIDDYAYNLGIEVFPCIQTLGHLGQVLQWPVYGHLKDTSEVLLANNDETYVFIRKLIRTVSKPLRSKRIHIGLDEANGVGSGRYAQIYGYSNVERVFMQHLQKVAAICVEEGLHALIWSDMLFTLSSQSPRAYYDDQPVSEVVNRNIPEDIQLVFWDYYHVTPELYIFKIEEHRRLGFEPWLASAVWTWNRMYSALPFTFDVANACMHAAKTCKIRNIIVTIWGDDGNECDVFSALPGLAYFGEQAYCTESEISWDSLKANFTGICGGHLEDWVYASKIDSVPSVHDRRERFPPNPSKWILWQDPVYSFLSPQYRDHNMELHYSEIAKYLFGACDVKVLQKYPMNYRLRFPALIAQTLALKCNIRQKIATAYKSPTMRFKKILQVIESDLKPLYESMRELHRYHQNEVWLDTYKPFGLEVLQMRYGAILVRLESLQTRLIQFCQDHDDTIMEETDGTASKTVLNDTTVEGIKQRVLPSILRDILPEFEVDIDQQAFAGHEMDLIFDFARSYTPSRALGTG